jgi:hypothetical protein
MAPPYLDVSNRPPHARVDLLRRGSAGIRSPYDFQRGPHKDCEIEFHAPIVDVPEVVFDAPFHMVGRWRWSSAAVNLRPAGQSRFHAPPEGVVSDGIVELVIERNRVWPRPDKRHAAAEYVKQLRKFVDACFAKPFSNRGDPLICGACLNRRKAVFHHRHRPEFVDLKVASVETVSVLPEQDRTWRAELYCDGYCDQQRGDDDQSETCANDVDAALGDMFCCAEWSALQFQANGIAEITTSLAQDFRGRSDGDERDRKRQHSQIGGQCTKFAPSLLIRGHKHFLDVRTANMLDDGGN